MEIKLRGKKWKQITPEVYAMANRRDFLAVFTDEFYGEKTYFIEVHDALHESKDDNNVKEVLE